MKRKIGGIALDFEGPVVDLEREGHHAAHRAAGKDAGIELSHEEGLELVPNMIGGPGSLIAQQFYDLMLQRGITPKLTPEEILERQREHFNRFLEDIRNGTQPLDVRPGFPEALQTFRSLGLKVMVGSSTESKQFWLYWRTANLSAFFNESDVVLADRASGIRHKPEPDIFLKTAKRMGVDPSEQLVIEDSTRGAKAGVAAGSMVVGMTVYDLPAAIKPLYDVGAVRVFCDWREVNWGNLIANLNEKF